MDFLYIIAGIICQRPQGNSEMPATTDTATTNNKNKTWKFMTPGSLEPRGCCFNLALFDCVRV